MGVLHRFLRIGVVFAAAGSVLSGCAGLKGGPSGTIDPPPVRKREIANMVRVAAGDTVPFGPNLWLFIPLGYTVPKSGHIELSMHFHTADWYAKEIHARRGAKNPLLIMGGLEGSESYRKPFLEANYFQDLLSKVAAHFIDQGAPPNTRVTSVEISSFSAGYGAVREILKSPEYVDLIHTVVLCDSMYAGFAVPGGGTDRSPLPAHVASFVDFARLAVDGKKTFVVSFSQVQPAAYASTGDTAKYLVHEVGGELESVAPGSCPAADPGVDYPLLYRYDKGGLHVWGYAGDDAAAHISQARAVEDFWKALQPEK